MLEFKLFDPDDLKIGMFCNFSEINVIFIGKDEVLRFGYLYEEYLYNGGCTYYFRSNGINHEAEGCLYCEISVNRK